jgi:hypothetical protein
VYPVRPEQVGTVLDRHMPIRQHDTRMLIRGGSQDRVDFLLPRPVLEGVDQDELAVRSDLSEELADLAGCHSSIGAEADHHDRAEQALSLESGDDLQACAELSANRRLDVDPWQR